MYLFTLPRAEVLLRIGVAFSLLYPPIAALSDPDSWIGYFPGFLLSLPIEPLLLLHMFGAVEGVLALWILFSRRITIPCVLTGILLILIVLFNGTQFPILFRDVSIALMAFALAFLHQTHEHKA